jgi:hypothetical protein
MSVGLYMFRLMSHAADKIFEHSWNRIFEEVSVPTDSGQFKRVSVIDNGK